MNVMDYISTDGFEFIEDHLESVLSDITRLKARGYVAVTANDLQKILDRLKVVEYILKSAQKSKEAQ